VTGRAVKVGIEAPKDVSIYRKEVYEAVKKENLEAQSKENILSLVDFVKKSKS